MAKQAFEVDAVKLGNGDIDMINFKVNSQASVTSQK